MLQIESVLKENIARAGQESCHLGVAVEEDLHADSGDLRLAAVVAGVCLEDDLPARVPRSQVERTQVDVFRCPLGMVDQLVGVGAAPIALVRRLQEVGRNLEGWVTLVGCTVPMKVIR